MYSTTVSALPSGQLIRKIKSQLKIVKVSKDESEISPSLTSFLKVAQSSPRVRFAMYVKSANDTDSS